MEKVNHAIDKLIDHMRFEKMVLDHGCYPDGHRVDHAELQRMEARLRQGIKEAAIEEEELKRSSRRSGLCHDGLTKAREVLQGRTIVGLRLPSRKDRRDGPTKGWDCGGTVIVTFDDGAEMFAATDVSGAEAGALMVVTEDKTFRFRS